jgi:chromosome segregation ATPase
VRSEALLETNRSLTAQADYLSTQNAALQGELSFYKSKCDAITPELISDDLTRQVALLQAQLEARDDENQRLRDATQASQAEAASRDDVIRKLHRRLKAARTSNRGRIDQMRAEMEALEGEMRVRTEGAKGQAAKRWQKKYRLLKAQLSESDAKVKALTYQLQTGQDEAAGFVVERECFENRLRQNEERLAEEREKAQALQAKLQRAEEEVEQLRCYLRLFASDDRRIRQLGAHASDVMQELEALKGRVDRFERALSGQAKRPAPARKRKGKPTRAWRTFRDDSGTLRSTEPRL